MKRLAVLCAAMAALAGCDTINDGVDPATHSMGSPMHTVQTFWVLDAVSLINTKKTIDDHLLSWILDRDCSILRASKGEHYCIDYPEEVPTVVRTSYCYRSLGRVSCFDRPIASNPNQFTGTRVDNVPVAR